MKVTLCLLAAALFGAAAEHSAEPGSGYTASEEVRVSPPNVDCGRAEHRVLMWRSPQLVMDGMGRVFVFFGELPSGKVGVWCEPDHTFHELSQPERRGLYYYAGPFAFADRGRVCVAFFEKEDIVICEYDAEANVLRTVRRIDTTAFPPFPFRQAVPLPFVGNPKYDHGWDLALPVDEDGYLLLGSYLMDTFGTVLLDGAPYGKMFSLLWKENQPAQYKSLGSTGKSDVGPPAIARAENGTVHLLWVCLHSRSSGADWSICYQGYCPETGWTPEHKVTESDDVIRNQAIACRGNDVYVFWTRRDCSPDDAQGAGSGMSETVFFSERVDEKWSAPEKLASFPFTGADLLAAATGNNGPLVVVVDVRNELLVKTRHKNQWSETIRLDSPLGYTCDLDVLVDDDGQIHLAYRKAVYFTAGVGARIEAAELSYSLDVSELASARKSGPVHFPFSYVIYRKLTPSEPPQAGRGKE